MAGATLLNLNGATLTLASGGLMAANSYPTISNGFLQSGLPSGELFVHALNGVNLTNSAVFQDNGATPTVLVKAGANTLFLTAANTYSGMTYVNQGTLQIGGAGSSGDLANSAGVVLAGGNLVFNRSDALTFRPPISGNGVSTVTRSAGTGSLTLGPLTGVATFTDSSTNGLVAPTVVTQSTAGLTIATLNGAKGSVVNFTGSGSTTIANLLATLGQLVKVSNGTVTNNSARNMAANIQVDGGRLTIAGDRLGMTNTAQTLVVNGGQLNVTGTYGIRLNGDNGTATADKSGTVTATQTGGAVSITQAGLQLGNLSGGTTSYTLSGGILNCAGNGVSLGNATTGAGVTTFTLSGTGKLLAGGTVSGSQGAGAIQNFVMNGGTLAVSAVDMTKLTSSGATSGTPATLYNNGGMLAPGDVGTAGKTTVTGSYTNAPSAVLAVDLGGMTQATAFQTGQYDLLNVNNGSAFLDGRLSVNLINGYIPTGTNIFDVLTSTGTGAALSGTFVNAADGYVYATDGLTRFDVTVDAGNKRVRLSNAAKNQWGSASAANWTNAAAWLLTQPTNSDYAAYFGTNLTSSGQVTLNEARTIRSLFFNNSQAFYTLAGTGSLTLQSDAFTAPAITVVSGKHTVEVPLALSSATTVTVENVFTPAGLYEGRLSGLFNTNSPNPQTSVQLSTRYANIYYVSSALSDGVWVDSSTYAYTGYIWNQTGTNTTWTFAKNFDDSVYLAIDGVAVINNTSYNTFVKANVTLTPGGHSFDLRLGQGVANVGASGGWGVQYDPQGRNSSSLTDYQQITDTGNGRLLTTVASPTFVEGQLTLSGGITGGQALTKTGVGLMAISGSNTFGALTVSAGGVRQDSGASAASSLSVESGAQFDLASGTLTCDSVTLNGAFNFLKNSTGALFIKKGLAGGALDTVSEVNSAISGGFITLGGLQAAPTDFRITEETVNSVVYIKVVRSVKGTVLLLQ
jgi:autotransporter-associated beta strand protein